MRAKARRMGMVVNDKCHQQRRYASEKYHDRNNSKTITVWVECMLHIGISDFRKRAIDLILAPVSYIEENVHLIRLLVSC